MFHQFIFDHLRPLRTTLIYSCLIFISIASSYGQVEDIDEMVRIEVLEGQVKHYYGLEKLEGLLDISSHYEKKNGRKSIRYARQAVILAEEIFLSDNGEYKTDSTNLLPKSYIRLGRSYFYNDKFIDSKEAFDNTSLFCMSHQYQPGIRESEIYLEKIDSLASGGQDMKRGFLSQTFKSLGKSVV